MENVLPITSFDYTSTYEVIKHGFDIHSSLIERWNFHFIKYFNINETSLQILIEHWDNKMSILFYYPKRYVELNI